MNAEDSRWPLPLVILLTLCLVACGENAPRDEETQTSTPGKVLVLGLDGADWEIIDPLIAAGRLPHFERLKREGAYGVLRSEQPLLSPIVWTTMATGRSPLDHGIYGFLTMREGNTEPVRSDERLVRAFWNISTELGVSVGVVGWYTTWPAEPVEGFLVSDRLAGHQVRGSAGNDVAGLVYPAELMDRIASMKAAVEADIGDAEARAYFSDSPSARAAELPAEKLDAFTHILRTTELYRRLTPLLLERYEPSLAAVFFEGTDSVGHLFQHFAPPQMPSVTSAEVARFGEVHTRYYERIDSVVGEFLEDVDPAETTVVVVSDHGFRTGARRPAGQVDAEYANQAPAWHREEGVILMWGRGIKRGSELPEATLYDVLPTVFRLLDIPLAGTLSGHPIDAALRDEILDTPVRTLADYELAGERARGELGDISADEDIAKLRALGYVGDSLAHEVGSAGSEGHLAIPVNRYNQALLYRLDGQLDTAREKLEELQTFAPEFAPGYFGEAVLLLESGDFETAIPLLERAVDLSPDFLAAWAELGESRFRMNQLSEAESAFEKALELEPNHPRVNLRLGQIRVSQRKFREASDLLARAEATLQDPGEAALAAVLLGVLAEQDRQLGKAENYYKDALGRVPNYPYALERYGNLMLYQERVDEALRLFELLTRNASQSPRAWQLYARALEIGGRFDEASRAKERAASLTE